jgi:hypothetical protein
MEGWEERRREAEEEQDGCAVGCFDGLNGRVVSCGCGEGC